MASAITNVVRLARAGLVLAQHGVSFVPKGMRAPAILYVARALTWPIRVVTWPLHRGEDPKSRVSAALTRLGPSYIKLGQFLATRADLIGPELSGDLALLQDKLPPFPMAAARRAIEQSLGGQLSDHFVEFGPPVAAASIAQVHTAVAEDRGERHAVAVKVLRPDVERRFRADLDSYAFMARMIERFHPPSRRLKPTAVVDNLKRTTDLEMDLRLEAAAISEMAENIKADNGFRVPKVDWKRTQKRVLTIEWIDGIPIWDKDRLLAAGHDLKELGMTVLRSFLRHAMRDGFFHADMHQGNLLVDCEGMVVAVDFGIMGRLGTKERRFLAEILHGLITRDYRRAAEVHFWAGYVPPHHAIETFAQALRAIGEPIHGRTAGEISMADLLGQLFDYTEVFDMETRPELILLQKSMVIVEGVARSLDPDLNMWVAAEPIAREWVEANLGLAGRLKEAGEGANMMGRLLGEAPRLIEQAESTAMALSTMARVGVRLDPATIRQIAEESATAERGDWLPWTIALLALAGAGVALFRAGLLF